jgi:hypothetical protein
MPNHISKLYSKQVCDAKLNMQYNEMQHRSNTITRNVKLHQVVMT